MSLSVKFFNCGYCSQSARLSGGASWRFKRYYAVFLLVTHPTRGNLLVDTGYSPEFIRATGHGIHSLYRYLLPTQLNENLDAAGVLRAHGIASESIDTIFVSHFHADHISGLKHFPASRFVASRRAWLHLNSLSFWGKTRELFLPELLPSEFERRTDWVHNDQFSSDLVELKDFRVLDYWGDQTMYLVDLPGHAIGQFGIYFPTLKKPLLYAVDATWNTDALRLGRQVPLPLVLGQHDPAAYRATWSKLRRLQSEQRIDVVACHCSATQSRVENRGDE